MISMNKFNIPVYRLQEMQNTMINYIFTEIKKREAKVKEIQVDQTFIDELHGAGNKVTQTLYARANPKKKLNTCPVKNNHQLQQTDNIALIIFEGDFIEIKKPYKEINRWGGSNV
jgi:hypothetical protein